MRMSDIIHPAEGLSKRLQLTDDTRTRANSLVQSCLCVHLCISSFFSVHCPVCLFSGGALQVLQLAPPTDTHRVHCVCTILTTFHFLTLN